MSLAPERLTIGLPPAVHVAGGRPLRRGRVGAPRRPDHELEGRHGRLRAARRRVPGDVVGERHQHRRPEVLPGHARHARSGSRRCARSSTASPTRSPRGAARAATSSTPTRSPGVRRRAEVHPRHPAGRLQQPGVVQHRRRGRAPAGLGVLHPRRRRHDGLDPQLVPRGGRHLQGRLRLGHQPVHASAPAHELLQGGGTASGPVSFMRGADASAGTIKSGGKTRRAAKMVILDVDHPDVEEFIWCKVKEERKARVLRDNGFDMDLDGADSFSIQYQNANNSVRVTDEFMQAVAEDADWGLVAVTTGEVLRTVKARDLWRQIAQAAWECADPGLQFDTTINRWHTAHTTGRINGSNPCSRVHAPRQLGLQPGLDQPAQVPRRRRQLRRRRLPPHGRDRLHGPGDPRRPGRLPDAADRRDQPRLPPARPRLRQPRRPADGARPALRLAPRAGPGRPRSRR